MSAVTTIVVTIALLAAVGILAVLHGRRSRALGRAEARAEQTGKALDNVEKANRARHRLRRDRNYARRLRQRFTRR